MDTPLEAATSEIERLHAFISGWFRGEIAAERFDTEFAGVLDPEFENIQPSGVVLSRSDLLEPIRSLHASNPAFRIEIREPRLLGVWPGLILATYVEAQFGALNTAPADNNRRSTAVFTVSESALTWKHLQETALPPD